MVHQTDLQLLTLAGIAHHCTQETELFFRRQRYDPRYCFELFRRAIVGGDQHAWELVYNQYRPLVAGWVERHSAFAASGEEVHYFINRAYEKMWSAVTPDRFPDFPDLKSLLRYLQVCVHSVILDQVRKMELSAVTFEDEAPAGGHAVGGPTSSNRALDRVHREEFWREVKARLRDEKEYKVVVGSFVLGLKPRELHARFRDTFHDVKEVYRVKENVIARLRRDAELAQFFGGDA